jgi:hypothetical protein
MSAREIAAMTDCAQPSVLWALRKFNIPIRSNSAAKTGRPSRTVWTPEMREALAAQRRGEANPMFGTVSPNRDKFKDGEAPSSKYTGRGRAQRIPAQPCEVCGAGSADRHHIDGDTMNNASPNIRFLCRAHHASVGHPDNWAGKGWSAEKRAAVAEKTRAAMTPERRAASSERMREVWRRARVADARHDALDAGCDPLLVECEDFPA